MEKLSIATDEIRKGGTVSRDLNDSLKKLREENAQLRTAVDTIEKQLDPDAHAARKPVTKKARPPSTA